MKTKAKLFYQFLVGFLSVFGLTNPMNAIIKRSDQPCDTEKLSKDWRNIGNDINRSYERFKSESFQ